MNTSFSRWNLSCYRENRLWARPYGNRSYKPKQLSIFRCLRPLALTALEFLNPLSVEFLYGLTMRVVSDYSEVPIDSTLFLLLFIIYRDQLHSGF